MEAGTVKCLKLCLIKLNCDITCIQQNYTVFSFHLPQRSCIGKEFQTLFSFQISQYYQWFLGVLISIGTIHCLKKLTHYTLVVQRNKELYAHLRPV